MYRLNDKELCEINGGAVKITAAFISTIVRRASVVLDLGRSLGSAIRRVQTGKICSL